MLVKDHSHLKNATEDRSADQPMCTEFEQLEAWQIKQYRKAVENHRADLSKEQGRCVGWFEAERDFFENDCFGLPEEWRVEYCGLICPHKHSCLLALHFLESKDVEQITRTG